MAYVNLNGVQISLIFSHSVAFIFEILDDAMLNTTPLWKAYEAPGGIAEQWRVLVPLSES